MSYETSESFFGHFGKNRSFGHCMKNVVFGVFMVRIFSHSDWIQTRKTPKRGTFHAVGRTLLKIYNRAFCEKKLEKKAIQCRNFQRLPDFQISYFVKLKKFFSATPKHCKHSNQKFQKLLELTRRCFIENHSIVCETPANGCFWNCRNQPHCPA